MKYGEILNEAMQLPVKQQHSLVWALSRGFPSEKRKQVKFDECKSRLWKNAAVMAQIADVYPEAIISRSRLRMLVYCRWIIWHKLYEEGFSQSLIAKVSGYHHSIACHGIGIVNDIKESPCHDIQLYELYVKFQNAISNESNSVDNNR